MALYYKYFVGRSLKRYCWSWRSPWKVLDFQRRKTENPFV